MPMLMVRGDVLSEDEKVRVLNLIATEAKSGFSGTGSGRRVEYVQLPPTKEFVSKLGWPQRRIADLRRFLEFEDGAERISMRLGRAIKKPLVTNSIITFDYEETPQNDG